MKMEQYIRLIAGSMILLSLLLAVAFSHWWLLLTAFVGVNLIQSVFSGWCLMEDLLLKLGVKKDGGGGA